MGPRTASCSLRRVGALDQEKLRELAGRDRLLILCGRYEGIDERVRLVKEWDEISLGDYILSGGEVAAMVILDGIARLQPGVLGHPGVGNARVLRRWLVGSTAVHPTPRLSWPGRPGDSSLRRSQGHREVASHRVAPSYSRTTRRLVGQEPAETSGLCWKNAGRKADSPGKAENDGPSSKRRRQLHEGITAKFRGGRYRRRAGSNQRRRQRAESRSLLASSSASRGCGIARNFTVRRIVQGEGVERVFPFHSPFVVGVNTRKRAKIRRSKLYYLRDRKGKRARMKERLDFKSTSQAGEESQGSGKGARCRTGARNQLTGHATFRSVVHAAFS